MPDQLPLFASAATEADVSGALDGIYAEAREIAADLPRDLYLGTSSWSFAGWTGIVYRRERATSELARNGLREYAQHPLLTTVGIDRSYYAPIPVTDLTAYAEQLPDGFPCCVKAPAAVTAFTLGPPGGRAERNPDFLSIDRLSDDLLDSLARAFRAHTGPIILEFPPFARTLRLEPDAFLDRLNLFLHRLPREFEYAIELRDPTLLTARYRAVVDTHAIAHTYNYWSAMPMPGDQAAVVPPEDRPFTILRLLLKPGTWYEDQRDAFRPFDRLVAPDEAMRQDVVELVQRTLARKKRVYILVNNKAEGSSPLTVLELAKRIRAERART